MLSTLTFLPKNIKIISQDEIIPKKLKAYFAKHSEIEKKLTKKNTTKILVTDHTESMRELAKKLLSGFHQMLVQKACSAWLTI